ncbi:MAG: N-acetylmuramoyl-L-alanine amidase family protein, partial [Sarcina sp.]
MLQTEEKILVESAIDAYKKLLSSKLMKKTNLTEFSNELIVTGIPLGNAVNSEVPGDTVMNMPNAQVVGNQNVPMVYLNGSNIPNAYASPGNEVKILEIFKNMVLVLIPVGSGAEGNGEWVIGYFKPSVLGNTVEVNYNTITWNDGSNKTVVDSNGNFLYSLPASQTIQFLYETTNDNYACILFNDSTGALATGYVSMSEGTFYRYSYLRSGALQPPKISDSSASLPSNIHMNLQTGLGTLDGSSSIVNSFNGINQGAKVPAYFELSNGLGCTVLSSSGNLKAGKALNTLNDILDNSNASNLAPGYYHHLYAPANYSDALSCQEQGACFGKALVSSAIPGTNYVLALKVDEVSFNNESDINLPYIEQCVTEFMNGLENVIQGNFNVMLYSSLNMINNVSNPPMYTSEKLTKGLLWMDYYLSGITDSVYEPTNSEIVNAFYEMNSIQWGGQTGWSIWGYEDSNNVVSCIVNLDAIYDANLYYNPVSSSSSSPSNGGSTNNPLAKGDVVEIKEGAEYFAQGPTIGSLMNDTFEIMSIISSINTGASDQSGYVIKSCSTGEEYNIYSDQVEAVKQVIDTGWKEINNSWYYFNSEGVMVKGWQTIDNVEYYFDNAGVMQTGWHKEWGDYYYFNSLGHMVKGWQTIDNVEYYFDNAGVMQTGWHKEWGDYYYFNSLGHMVKGWQTIDNVEYYFDNAGVMQTGWHK